MPSFKFFLKLYFTFGALHVCYKWLRLLKQYALLARFWRSLPGKDCDVFAKEILKRTMDVNDYHAELASKYPSAPLIKVPRNIPTLFCNTEESVKWMLSDEFENISKIDDSHFFITMLKKFLGENGIFTVSHGAASPPEHEKWKYVRTILAKITTNKNYKTVFYDGIVARANILVDCIEDSAPGTVDVQQLFFRFTIDAMEQIFLGKEPRSLQDGLSEFGSAFDKTQDYLMTTLISSFKFDFFARLFLPFPFGTLNHDDNFLNSLVGIWFKKFSGEFRKFKEQVSRIDKEVYRYIASVKKASSEKQNDIASLILSSQLEGEATDTLLRDIVVNLTLASRDTTACGLSWIFYELSSNEDVQKKLQQEIDLVLGEVSVPSLEQLSVERMPYLNAVVYEVLRLHPPAPRNSMLTKKDLRYLDGTFIPKGTMLRSSPYAMARKECNYEDPLVFQPERWLPFEKPSDYQFAVFQAGRRSCLGKDLALMEMKLVTCMLLKKFSFNLSSAEKAKISYTPGLTMAVCNNEAKTSRQLLCKVLPR